MFQWNIAIPINLTNQSWRRPYSPMRVVVHPAVMGMLMKWKHLTNLTLIKDWKIRRQNCCSVCSVHWKRRLQLTSEPVTYSHEVRDKKNSMNFFMNSCGTEEKRARARARVSLLIIAFVYYVAVNSIAFFPFSHFDEDLLWRTKYTSQKNYED